MQIYNENLIKSVFFASVKIENYIYFSHWLINGLLRLALNTQKIELLSFFDEESQTSNLHNKAFVFGNQIWFIPSTNGTKIAIYDLDTGEMEYIPLPAREHCTMTNKFSCVVKDGQTVWIIPDGYDALLHIDCKKRNVEIYDKWPEYLKWDNDVARGFKGAAMFENKIYMYPFEGRHLCIFDSINHSMTNIDIPPEISNESKMMIDESRIVFWNPKELSDIWLYNLKDDVFSKADILLPQMSSNYAYYSGNVFDSKLWLVPFSGQQAVCIDVEKKKAEKFDLEIVPDVDNEDLRYQSTTCYDDGIIFTSDYEKNGKVMPIVYISKDLGVRCFQCPSIETVDCLKHLIYCKENKSCKKNDVSNLGNRIYGHIIGEI